MSPIGTKRTFQPDPRLSANEVTAAKGCHLGAMARQRMTRSGHKGCSNNNYGKYGASQNIFCTNPLSVDAARLS
jgi:hypothetical protein